MQHSHSSWSTTHVRTRGLLWCRHLKVDLSAHKIICLATDSYMSVYYRPSSGLYTRKQDDLFEETVVKLQMEWRRHLPCKQQQQRSVPPSASDSNYETLSYTDGIHSLTTHTNQAAIHPVPVPLTLHNACGDPENKINHRWTKYWAPFKRQTTVNFARRTGSMFVYSPGMLERT